MKLKTKLLVGGILVAIIPVFTIGALSLTKSTKALQHIEERQLVNIRSVLISYIDSILRQEKVLLKNFTKDQLIEKCIQFIQNGMDKMSQYYFDNVSTNYHDKKIYHVMFIANKEGKVVADTLKGKFAGKNIAQEEYFKEALSGKTVIGKVVKVEGQGKTAVVVASPLESKGNGILGVAVAYYNMDNIMNKLNSIKIGKTGYAFLLDRAGLTISHPDKKVVMNVNMGTLKGMEKLCSKMTSGDEGLEEYTYKGTLKKIAYGPIKTAGWSLGLTVPEAEYMAPVTSLRNIIIIIGAGLLLLTLLAILWFTRGITRPIDRVVKGLEEASTQVASAAGQVSAASQQLAEGASEQAASLEETSSSLEEMSSMTRQTAQNAAQAKSSRQEAYGALKTADHAMKETMEAMGRIKSRGEEIGKIIKTIDEIAFQTNLLALNAAVEAARAGEAGAGFAVVADEVRNLAMRAAEAAKNTQVLIEETVAEINTGSELVEKTNQAFGTTMEYNDKVGKIIEEIAAASEEQAQGIEQVAKAVGEMDKVTQRNAANAQESAAASQQLNASAEQMKSLVLDLVTLVGSGANGSANGRSSTLVRMIKGKGKEGMIGGRKKKERPALKTDLKTELVEADQVIPMEENQPADF